MLQEWHFAKRNMKIVAISTNFAIVNEIETHKRACVHIARILGA